MPLSTGDELWMQRAVELAARGEGRVEPNPMVGCVLVSGSGENAGQLLGEGYHQRFGEPHAERMAIADATRRGNRQRLAGATAYVTLEPCCHYGKTPPCTDALLEAGIRRVVVALADPFAQVAGRGLELLRQAGVSVELGPGADEARQLNAPYLKRLLTGRPWVIAKWAMSLDGKLATHCGDSQWITGPASRAEVQRLRGRVDAIVVGRRTAQLDNPRLTARTPEPPLRTAWRVVIDSQLQLPLDSQLVATAQQTPVLLACGPEASTAAAQALRQRGCHIFQSPKVDRQQRLDALLQYLAQELAATNVLVEGGGELLGSLFDLRQLDQCEVFIAPKLIGGVHAVSPLAGVGLERLSAGPTTYARRVQTCGDDVHVSLRLGWPDS